MNLKNALIKNLVFFLKPTQKPLNAKEKRFLVVSTTALGDTLWATPAIRALRETFPNSEISVLTSPLGKEVLLQNPHIDEIFTVGNPALRDLCSHYTTLKKKSFTHAFIFHTSQRPVLPFVALLGPQAMIGSSGINKGLDCLLTECLPREQKMHEIERRLNLVAKAGAQTSSLELEFCLTQEEEQKMVIWLDSLSLRSGIPIIAFHPGAKDAFRQWPSSHFIELGKRLKSNLDCHIFITGTASEKPLVEKICSGIQSAMPVTHLPLRSFAAFIKKLHLMVTNDTGPLHVSFAMKTPTLALFAPSDPDRFGPYHAKNAIVIAKRRTCSPCLIRKCASSFCFLQIGVKEVYDTALSLINNRPLGKA